MHVESRRGTRARRANGTIDSREPRRHADRQVNLVQVWRKFRFKHIEAFLIFGIQQPEKFLLPGVGRSTRGLQSAAILWVASLYSSNDKIDHKRILYHNSLDRELSLGSLLVAAMPFLVAHAFRDPDSIVI